MLVMAFETKVIGGWIMAIGAMIFFLSILMPPSIAGFAPASSVLFSISLVFAGIGVLAIAYHLMQIPEKAAIGALSAAISIGLIGIGIFHGAQGIMLNIAAAITLISSIIAAIIGYRAYYARAQHLFAALGGIAIVALLIFAYSYVSGADINALMNVISYPFFLWMLFAGAAIASNSGFKKAPEKKSRASPKSS